MSETFDYDVFLSHSAKDKAIVRPLAERLRADGLKVWLDEWEIKPGDSIPAKIEDGLERSRVLVLCMSANAFGSDWAQLESGTFRFRDPLNKDRRFIPLRLDAAPIKGSLAQFHHINWQVEDREQEYAKLLEACRPPGGHEKKADTLQHVARLVRARRSEWERVRSDFQVEARKYHDVKMSTFFVTKDEPTDRDTFPQPSHVISLWQYFGSTQSSDTIDRLRSECLTDFGMTGSEISAFGLVIGQKTKLFCKMATRSGSLLPDEINHIIIGEIAERFASILGPGKPILISNSNPLAKWLNLMLAATTSSHPKRFKDGVLAVDPFVASLPVFDFFSLGESGEEPMPTSSDNLGSSTPPPRSVGVAWSGLRGLLEQAYSTKVIKGVLGKAGLAISEIEYTGTFKGPFLDEADRLVRSLSDEARDRFVVGCIQEILASERMKAANLSERGIKPGDGIMEDLRLVLARFGHDLAKFEST